MSHDLYLLIGQSNMAGRAPIEEPDRPALERVYLLNDQDGWEIATNPLNRYSTIRKVMAMQKLGPGYTFGRKLSTELPDKTFGLVVNVRGGSAMDEWAKGERFYEEALKKIAIAMPAGEFKAILWHQGCSDRDTADTYLDRLEALIANLREVVGNPELPFIAGEIGRFVENHEGINAALMALPDRVPHTACVTAERLSHIGDSVHFDSRSQRALGERYAAKVLNMVYHIS